METAALAEIDAAEALAIANRFLAASRSDVPPSFRLARFQQDALSAARRILARRGGVLIADGVGLGKTFVALALIEEELRGGGNVLVTGPAALRRHWQLPLLRLARRHGCTSSGLTKEPRRARAGVPHLEWLSHTRLSRRDYPLERAVPHTLIVIDEAHGCRNPATRRYRALAIACSPARVVLLTATPVCNSLSDLYFLIRLFAADSAFQDVGVLDLAGLLRAEQPEIEKVRAVLAEVMVRRTRGELAARHGPLRLPHGRGFPRLDPPTIVRYPPRADFGECLALVESLRFPPLRLGAYGAHEGEEGAELVRCTLLKRFESSDAAARASVIRLTRFVESFLAALDAGRLLTARDFRRTVAIHAGSEQLLLHDLVLENLPRRLDRRRLRVECRAELHRLRRLAAHLETDSDTKLHALRELLAGHEGVLVFTEFQETARLLWRDLVRAGLRVARVDGGGAYLGVQRATRAAVVSRFAPRANGFPAPHARERVDILIATDLLSEGLNLQDAQAVVSYDLPWNPTRMMQRVGRIDRLGSPHDRIASFAFMPGDHLEALLGLVQRIRGKLRIIEESVGVEALPLEPAGWVHGVAGTETSRDATADFSARDSSAPDCPGIFFVSGTTYPPVVKGERIRCAALCVTAEAAPTKAGVLVFGRLGTAPAACFFDAPSSRLVPITEADVRGIVERGARADGAVDRELVQRAIGATARTAAWSAPPGPVATRAARLLLRALGAARTTPSELQRSEVLLARLRAGLPMGAELRLRSLLRAPPVGAEVLIAELEAALGNERRREATAFQPFLALEIRPAPSRHAAVSG